MPCGPYGPQARKNFEKYLDGGLMGIINVIETIKKIHKYEVILVKIEKFSSSV